MNTDIHIPNQEMLALAYAAYRVNGYQYIKETRRFSEEKPTQFANKDLVKFYLSQITPTYLVQSPKDFEPFQVTEADYASVERARNYFKRYTIDLLGDNLSEFQKAVYKVFCSEQISLSEAGVAAYLPQMVDRELEDIAFKKLLRTEYRDSKHIGVEGSSVEGVVKVLKKFWSPQWGKFNYTAELNGNIISFMNGFDYEINSLKRIKAKVKSHTKNRLFSVDETRLNYVKLYKV